MSEKVKRYDCSSGGAKFCQGCYTMEECEHGDYVQHEDYARLEQECDRLKELCGGYVIGLDDERRKTISQSNMVGRARKERDAALAVCERLSHALRVSRKELYQVAISRDDEQGIDEAIKLIDETLSTKP